MLYSIIVTERCNLDCTYCYERNKQNRKMSMEMVPSIIEFIKQYQQEEFVLRKDEISINFNGGEALLNFDVVRALTEEIKKLGSPIFSLSTNLTVISDEILDFLYNNGVSLHISLDGRKELHDKNRIYHNGKGSFDDVIKNVEYLRKRYPDWNNSYNITLTPEHAPFFYESYMFLAELGVKKISAAYCADYLWDEQAVEAFDRSMEQISAHYFENYNNEDKIDFKFLDSAIRNTMHNAKERCGVFIDELGILPSGEILPCGAYVGLPDYEKFVVGNINEGIESLNRKVIMEKYLGPCKIDDEECNGCELQNKCHTMCYAVNERVMQNEFILPDNICHINQISLKYGERVAEKLYKAENSLFLQHFGEIIKRAKESKCTH